MSRRLSSLAVPESVAFAVLEPADTPEAPAVVSRIDEHHVRVPSHAPAATSATLPFGQVLECSRAETPDTVFRDIVEPQIACVVAMR